MPAPQHYDDLPMYWVGDWAGRRAALTPRRIAIYDPAIEHRFTYAELNERAERVGTYLTERLGVRPGERVSFIARNRIEAVDLYLAAGKCGFILAPLSYRLAPRELNDLLGRIEPAVFLYEDVFDDLVNALTMPDSVRKSIRIADEGSDYQNEVLSTEPGDVNRELRLNDPFLYIHTGGTTATPKICIVPHRQMLWNSVELLVASGGALGETRELLTFPLFHIGGWNTFTPLLHSGGYQVLMREFDPGTALELLEREQITHFGAVEAMLQFMAQHPRFPDTDLDSVAGITTAGAPCSAAVMRPFWERGIPVAQAYGMTEAGPSNFVNAGLDQSMDEIWERNASIGQPFFHSDYKIVDPETLEPVPKGESGVLCMRSPHSFQEYLGQPERTEKIFLEGGWVYSGDLAREDEDGYVYLVGRADNMFISGGENISPEEIENALNTHPAVAQAVVIGVPDDRWGQVALAAIVAKPGAQVDEKALTAHCREQLASFKVPRRFEFVDEIPVTGPGKIDRQGLMARFTKGGG